VIVVSLLLILVAVTLLVLGLAGGSSALLISSIVASLLAAVSLVIGARQAATQRRGTAPAGVPPTPDEDPFFADAPGLDEFAGDPPPGWPGQRSGAAAGSDFSGPSGSDFSVSDPIGEDPATEPSRRTEPDYDHASSVIGAARNADGADESWRRDPDAEAPTAASATPAAAPSAASSADPAGDVPSGPDDRAGAFPAGTEEPGSFTRSEEPEYPPDSDDYGFAPGSDDRGFGPGPDDRDFASASGDDDFADEGRSRDSGAADDPGSAATAPAEEFGEPDEDDPADEPLPQAVRPGDAVRVARMDAEVLVVDGRPRYHVADCPHLMGRLTEPLPANEAVELGFSPCGLCRPVDRLVAQAAHR
jgi:hypothetical protein